MNESSLSCVLMTRMLHTMSESQEETNEREEEAPTSFILIILWVVFSPSTSIYHEE